MSDINPIRRKPDTQTWQVPDRDQRDLIVSELDSNVLVEAAAGTGKTTSILRRMVALLSTGRCEIRNMSAVTFTRKAAAELRSRFQVRLERAAREARGGEKEYLVRALSHVEQCFIGTVHSFCARLLRERPVEAGVDPAFQEIDELADERIRHQAWDEFTARLMVHDPGNILGELDRLGLSLSDLRGAFVRFTDFPDVDEWPIPSDRKGLPDLEPAVEAVRDYTAHMARMAPLLPSDWGNDTLIRKYISLPRIASHYDDLREPARLMELLERFNRKARIVQKEWVKDGRFTKDDAKREAERWDTFRRTVAEPLIDLWRVHRYGPVLRAMTEARDIYDEMRVARGLLNFQDLLMKTAELLRDSPAVREYFRRRYTHILVDEFQDTDPVQAEVMMLLTADDPRERNWRRCRPSPGSLFIVGDPKQSIYRFRRADIVTYNEVKSIVCGDGETVDNGGILVRLSANFRSIPPVIDWVNEVFGPRAATAEEPEGKMLRFPPDYTDESPSYVALEKGRPDGGTTDLSGVYQLTIPAEHSRKNDAILYEADRIARTIRSFIDSGISVHRTAHQAAGGWPERAIPSDFMILTRNRKNLSVYARGLQEYGIPHRVTGGSALNEVTELGMLHDCLRAVVHRDDPVALVSALRGRLFGISDAALYRYKRSGGSFSYDAKIPESLSPESSEPIRDAFERLGRYAGWLSSLPPITALERVVADLGLMVLASCRPGGDVEAGSLAKAIEILRRSQGETWTAAGLVEHLGELVEKEEQYDGVSARSWEQPAVRIMNLHRAKGLEAPVVFLADPSGEFDHEVELHVDRSEDKILGYMAVRGEGSGYHYPLLAHPEGWDIVSSREKLFRTAEELRLRYVAATRACSGVIISQRERNNRSNPWQYFAEYVPPGREVHDPGDQSAPPGKTTPITSDAVKQASDNIDKNLETLGGATYHTAGAKEYALSTAFRKPPEEEPVPVGKTSYPPIPAESEGEYGAEWGTVIHQLLRLAMEGPGENLLNRAREMLVENDLDADLADSAVSTVSAVMGSGIWQRALTARKRLIEVPFQVLLEDDDRPPTVLRGAVDLVFEEETGWVLVDYKTDILDEKDLPLIAERYAPQVLLYAKAWEMCTGEAVQESGLYFVRADAYVTVGC